MGRPKALLSWGDTTLIEYQVEELIAAGVDELVVVLGHGADEIRPHVPAAARIVVNEGYQDGRASSLRAGAAGLSDDAGPIVVLNVDQPRPREMLSALLSAHLSGGTLVTVPSVDGKRGHPPVLAGALLTELRAATEEAQGLRGIITAHRRETHEAVFDSPILLLDVNTPDQYQRALAEFGRPSRDG